MDQKYDVFKDVLNDHSNYMIDDNLQGRNGIGFFKNFRIVADKEGEKVDSNLNEKNKKNENHNLLSLMENTGLNTLNNLNLSSNKILNQSFCSNESQTSITLEDNNNINNNTNDNNNDSNLNQMNNTLNLNNDKNNSNISDNEENNSNISDNEENNSNINDNKENNSNINDNEENNNNTNDENEDNNNNIINDNNQTDINPISSIEELTCPQSEKELLSKSNSILNNETILEEEKSEMIEQLVKMYSEVIGEENITNQIIEKRVLEIMWKHREDTIRKKRLEKEKREQDMSSNDTNNNKLLNKDVKNMNFSPTSWENTYNINSWSTNQPIGSYSPSQDINIDWSLNGGSSNALPLSSFSIPNSTNSNIGSYTASNGTPADFQFSPSSLRSTNDCWPTFFSFNASSPNGLMNKPLDSGIQPDLKGLDEKDDKDNFETNSENEMICNTIAGLELDDSYDLYKDPNKNYNKPDNFNYYQNEYNNSIQSHEESDIDVVSNIKPISNSLDHLRETLGLNLSNEKIENIFEQNGYDLEASLIALVVPKVNGISLPGSAGSSTSPSNFPSKSVCRFYLASGSCLRPECKFSHDLTNFVCRYWLSGSCLARENCVFLHQFPEAAINKALALSKKKQPTVIKNEVPPALNDDSAFPSLGSAKSIKTNSKIKLQNSSQRPNSNIQTIKMTGNKININNTSKDSKISKKLPNGSQLRQDLKSSLNSVSKSSKSFIKSTSEFPSLGDALNEKNGLSLKGSIANAKPITMASIASIPSGKSSASLSSSSTGFSTPLANTTLSMSMMKNNNVLNSNSRGKEGLARKTVSIPPPTDIPWVETGVVINSQYMIYRSSAISHGNLRNRYQSLASSAWARNDPVSTKNYQHLAAKEDKSMREAHEKAAEAIFAARNKDHSNILTSRDLFIDLHGLHPEEGALFLEAQLSVVEKKYFNSKRPVYVIVGTGHHSKEKIDKLGDYIRSWLREEAYYWEEFGTGRKLWGVLGIDPWSHR